LPALHGQHARAHSPTPPLPARDGQLPRNAHLVREDRAGPGDSRLGKYAPARQRHARNSVRGDTLSPGPQTQRRAIQQLFQSPKQLADIEEQGAQETAKHAKHQSGRGGGSGDYINRDGKAEAGRDESKGDNSGGKKSEGDKPGRDESQGGRGGGKSGAGSKSNDNDVITLQFVKDLKSLNVWKSVVLEKNVEWNAAQLEIKKVLGRATMATP